MQSELAKKYQRRIAEIKLEQLDLSIALIFDSENQGVRLKLVLLDNELAQLEAAMDEITAKLGHVAEQEKPKRRNTRRLFLAYLVWMSILTFATIYTFAGVECADPYLRLALALVYFSLAFGPLLMFFAS